MLNRHSVVFSIFWLVTFILYLPATKAGMVGDMPYLLESANQTSFWDFINIKGGIALYHVAAFHFYVLIKLFGSNMWLWHLLYISMHSLNACLMFIFFKRLLRDSGVANAAGISFTTAFLFIVCPHASEVVVWEASNHHSFATLSIFIVLILVQKFQTTQKKTYAISAAALFLYSSFSHEFFYLTPWLALAAICYYRFACGTSKPIFRKSILWVFVPLLLLFIFHLLLLYVVKHTYVSHFGKLEMMPITFYLNRPIKYIFHVLFFGRYFSFETRNQVYAFCELKTVIYLFYTILVSFWAFVLFRLQQVSGKTKALALTSACMMMVFLFISPVDFADSLLVRYDRYVYPSIGFGYLSVVLLVSLINLKILRWIIFTGLASINIYFAVRVNIYWKQSAYVVKRLLNELPEPGNKTVLLLNLPDDLNGIPMIAAEEDGRFKSMKNALSSTKIDNKVYDVVAYKTSTMEDGAHVTVMNDSVLKVTLNQWGTWWLYGNLGAGSYENKNYKVNMVDEGHWYILTLKKPNTDFLLLYQVGSIWKTVDMSKKDVDQY